ncbi:MAG: HK97 gp10 family phage protein [Clostridium perfringens]|uniref:HK97-gp10 family putative phage morphogenesis protein n=1 Tax=Clostridium perfringens TaxID=1502 RepID=UPI001CAC73C2|nr:HK97-gp10 family putative phage morphogenesis protein [Clostridium perfringens]MDO6336455.1 HK97 gp10 family phage protein [Clostridium perfringens]MDU6689533.1 HK97 gp10 family phage protein [Clostridium perfringens]HBI7133076.1 HK97 gp10 family phage protein [Clostridium perfringens]
MGLQFDFSELKQKLSELDNKVQNEISEKALVAGAEPIEQKQKQLAPVKTGELKRSLVKGRVKKSKGIKKIKIGVQKEASQDIKDRAYYQNYGFRSRGGLFFMEQSIESTKSKAVEEMAKVIKEGLK